MVVAGSGEGFVSDARERITEADLEEIERLARENESETYRGPLLALVDEVRRLREMVRGEGYNGSQ